MRTCYSQGDAAGDLFLLDHVDGGGGQHDAHAGHHAVGDVCADEVHDLGEHTAAADDGHDDSAKEHHGAALGAVLARSAGVGDGLGLEGDGCHALGDGVADGADEEGQGGGLL